MIGEVGDEANCFNSSEGEHLSQKSNRQCRLLEGIEHQISSLASATSQSTNLVIPLE